MLQHSMQALRRRTL